MKINLTSIRLSRTGDNGLRIAMTRRDVEESPTFYIISRDEFPQIKSILEGNEKYSPYMDDGLYLLKFGFDGIHCANTDGRKDVHDYFTFPARELIPHMEYLFNQPEGDIDLTGLLADWKGIYSANVRVVFAESSYDGFDVESKLLEDQTRFDVTNQPLDLISRLTHIAESYSDGNLITVSVYFDERPTNDKPASYYWSITNEQNQRCMNGGFIAHRKYYDESKIPEGEYQTYEYSIHT